MAALARALAAALPTYPAEAAAALGNSVLAEDELDERCSQPTHGRLSVRLDSEGARKMHA